MPPAALATLPAPLPCTSPLRRAARPCPSPRHYSLPTPARTQFNASFMDREEDAVVRARALQDGADAALAGSDSDAHAAAYRALIDFHGELLIQAT